MRRPFFLPVATAAVLACAAGAALAGATARLGPAPTLGGGAYSTGGGITVAVELRQIGSQTGLCGVWAESEQLTVYARGKARDVLSKGKITLGAETLTHDLGFLRQVPPAQSYAGAPAGCVKLARPWQPGDLSKPLQVRIPRMVVDRARNGHKDGGNEILFRQTSGENSALGRGSLLPKSWTSFPSTPYEKPTYPEK